MERNVARVDVMSTKVYSKSFEKDGRKFQFREQEVYMHLVAPDGTPDPVPTKVSLSLEGDAEPYAVGVYEFSLRSLVVGGFNRLQVGRVRLDPVPGGKLPKQG